MSLSQDKLRKWIKTKLGYPTVMVELSDDQLDICIEDALDELSPWIIDSKFVTLPVSQCIDMSEYNPSYVIRVYKSDNQSNVDYNDNMINVFDPTSTFGVYNSSSMLSRQTNGMSQLIVEKKIYNNTFSALKDNISFKYIEPNLYLDIGFPKSKFCVVEYVETIDSVEKITSELYLRFLKKFSLAYARLMIYEIRGKYTLSDTPTQLNADTQLSQANQELEDLRNQLLSSINSSFIID